jgi:hypothetical protein
MTYRTQARLFFGVLWIGFFALLYGQSAAAGPITQQLNYSWTAPTTRADGSALAADEIASYNIYYKIDAGTEQKITVTPSSATAKTVSLALAAKAAPYTIVSSMTTVDSDGLESARSNVVTMKLTVQNALPSPTSNVKISVNCIAGSCAMVVQ